MSVVWHGEEGLPRDPERSQIAKERVYAFDAGLLWLGSSAERDIKRRREATVSMAVGGEALDIRLTDETILSGVVVLRPMARYSIGPAHLTHVSALIAPNHPCFHLFRSIPDPGVLLPSRAAFGDAEQALMAVYDRALGFAEARRLFDSLVTAAVEHLPPPKPRDRRVERIIALLDENVNRPLDELAATVHLSYYRMSHLFSENVGLSLRSYQLWRKLRAALRLLVKGRKQIEIAHSTGFTDIAHLRRVCYESYGVPPSHFLNDHIEFHRYDPPTR